MRAYIPFELSGPTQVFRAFYKDIANQARSIAGLQGTTVKVAQLSEMSADLGEVRAGVFVSSAANDGSGFPGDASFSGVVISGAGIPTTNGDTAFISTWDTDVTQMYVGPDGKLYAGAGAVTLDADGVTLAAPVTSASDPNTIKWKTTDDSTKIAEIYSFYTGSGADKSAALYIISEAKSGGSGTFGELHLLAEGPAGINNSTRIDLTSNPGNPMLGYKDSFNNSGSLHYGNYGAAFTKTITTSASTLFSETIKGNSLGDEGQVSYRVMFKDNNTSGANRSHTLTYSFGGTTISHTFTVANVVANPSDTIIVQITTWNDAATNSQITIMEVNESANNNSGTLGTLSADAGWLTSTIDTTSDVTASLTLTSNNNAAGQTVKGVWTRTGPYYA